MIQLIKNRDYSGIGLFILLAVLVAYQQFVSPAIGFFLLIVLAEFVFLKVPRFGFNKTNILFILLFLCYLSGLIWSDHPAIGWKLLEYKMSFFIFPIAFMGLKKSTAVHAVLSGLIWGAMILTIRIFWIYYFSDHAGTHFYEISREIIEVHPTYISIYLTIVIIFLLLPYGKKLWPNYARIPLSLIFVFTIYQIGSFAALLFLMICVAIITGYFIFKKIKWAGLIIYVILCPLVIAFSVKNMKTLAYDLEMVEAVYADLSLGKSGYLEKNRLEISGTKERVSLWLISAEIIAENPFGVGTGDIDFHILEKCEKYKMEVLKQQILNPHNQFLQIGIDIGWPGIFLLVGILVLLFYKAILSGNYLLFFVTLSLTFNSFFESVLQRQSGIVFYTLLICLAVLFNDQLASVSKQKEKANEV